MKNQRFVAVIAFVCAAGTSSVARGAADHLTCYKISDPLKVSATADLDTSLLGVSSSCHISKAALLCAPSDLQNLVSTTPALALGGPRAPGESLCYKVKCPLPNPVSQQISDEFGTRTVTKFKTSLVCSPTVPSPAQQFSGFAHYPRGLAQLTQTSTADGPTLHVQALDGLALTIPDVQKSSTNDPGGSGVVVVLQNVSDIGVRVRNNADSRASLAVPKLRVGAVLNVKGHGGTRSESMAEAVSVAAGNSGVSSTAYFPRLQRQATGALRTATLTCAGAPAGSSSETVVGDPTWTWFSPVWPDRYDTRSLATTDEAEFVWEKGCVNISDPGGSGVVFVADKLVISMDNGSSPQLFHKLQISGSGGLTAFALKDEASH